MFRKDSLKTGPDSLLSWPVRTYSQTCATVEEEEIHYIRTAVMCQKLKSFQFCPSNIYINEMQMANNMCPNATDQRPRLLLSRWNVADNQKVQLKSACQAKPTKMQGLHEAMSEEQIDGNPFELLRRISQIWLPVVYKSIKPMTDGCSTHSVPSCPKLMTHQRSPRDARWVLAALSKFPIRFGQFELRHQVRPAMLQLHKSTTSTPHSQQRPNRTYVSSWLARNH